MTIDDLGAGTRAGDELGALYRDLHRNPELSFQEERPLAPSRGVCTYWATRPPVGGPESWGCRAMATVRPRCSGQALTPCRCRRDRVALRQHRPCSRPRGARGRRVPRLRADIHGLPACWGRSRAGEQPGVVGGDAAGGVPAGGGTGPRTQAMIDDRFSCVSAGPRGSGPARRPPPAGFLALRPGPAFAAADSVRSGSSGRRAAVPVRRRRLIPW